MNQSFTQSILPIMKAKLILFLFLCISFFSCEKEETIDYRVLAAGEWSGTFEGDDMGTWTMSIKSDGTLTGGLLSTNVPGITFLGTGNVRSDGSISADIQVSTSTSVMTGTVDGNEMTGTWSNSSSGISGTWKGTKK